MNRAIKPAALILAGMMVLVGVSACEGDEYQQRKASVAAKADPNRKTLEQVNLSERKRRQERATAIGYVYLLNFGKPFGYYVIKGKVSSSGSQLTPEQDIICRHSGDSCQAVDGPQDDGTYGQGDPGIFFYTASGVMVETSVDYIYSDQPLEIKPPLLKK